MDDDDSFAWPADEQEAQADTNAEAEPTAPSAESVDDTTPSDDSATWMKPTMPHRLNRPQIRWPARRPWTPSQSHPRTNSGRSLSEPHPFWLYKARKSLSSR